MATGYTVDLKDGKPVTFREFAMRCARDFGALIMMRDEPLDATIPDEFQPSNYHRDAIKMARKRLAEVKGWSNARAEKEAEKVFDGEVCSNKKAIGEKRKIRGAYTAMLEQVENWVPPTKDHKNLKCFMIEQLTKSIEFDCSDSDEFTVPQQLSGKQYRDKLTESAHRDIAYHTKEYEEEVKTARKRSEWVRDLRRSLNGSN